MDKNSLNPSQEIVRKDKFLTNRTDSSRSSNLSPATSSHQSRPIQTKISKLSIYDSKPDSPAKFTIKSVHTRMNHDYQPDKLINKKINQSFKPRNINSKEFNQEIAAEYEKKKLERHNDCQNIKNLLNEIQQNNLETNGKIEESNDILSTPPTPNNINILNCYRSNRAEKFSFKSKQILSAIEVESKTKDLNNFTEDNLKEKPSENPRIAVNTDFLSKEMEPPKLETVLENTYQNKITNYGKRKHKIFGTSSIENNELSRSKTDIPATATGRSDYLQISPPKTVRSQSSININSDCTTDRKKSYNPEEARRFMQEQRKKRKISSIHAGEEIVNDKEAIKKRLEDLRKHSLRILQRNVKIAKKKDPIPQQQYQEMPSTSTTRNINGQMIITKAVNQREEEHVLKPQNIKSTTVQDSARMEKPNSLEIKSSKIGMLRKETEDNSFSALNDKENIVLNKPGQNPTTEILQKITDTLSRKKSVENILNDNESEKAKIDFENNEKKKHNVFNNANHQPKEFVNMYESLRKNPHNSLKSSLTEGIDLKVPDVKLNSKLLHSEKSVQCDNRDKPLSTQNSLPYWLKPTPIQIYPYNFIMAVRKKLEAITNPTLATNDDYKHVRSENNPKNTPVSHLTKNKVQTRRRIVCRKEKLDLSNSQKWDFYSSSEASKISKKKIRDNELLECVTSNPAIIKEKETPEKKNYKSSTDTNSNFSSMSIHIPKKKKNLSNGLLSSTKIDGRNDDTTISSSVFSSPEKKIIQNGEPQQEENSLSPLSTENISNLRIKSKYINMDRGDNIMPNNLQADNIMNEVDFNQFLNDFNQSLSQVIEVNQQLKVTLDKSNKIFSRKLGTTQNQMDMKKDEYTSDFEEETINTARNSVDSSNLLLTVSNHSNIQESTIIGADTEKLNHDSLQSNNNIIDKNLEKHSTDSEIVEIITSDTLSRTISVSVKSSKNDNSEHSTKSLRTSKYSLNEAINNLDHFNSNKSIQNDIPTSSPSSSGSENHSIKIIHQRKIENYSDKSNDFLESEDIINKNKIISSFDFDMIPEKLNENPPLAVEDTNQTQREENELKKKIINSSASSEFVAIFNQSDFEYPQNSESNLSESTLNYSSIGLYEQLLQNENRKTEQLAAFLRMREKVILDRAKGQIAWLEVQREKLRSKKNLTPEETTQLITLKKRQRGILLKMDKERDEIQKLLQNQSEVQSSQSRPNKYRNRPKLTEKISDVTIRKSVITNNVSSSSRVSTSIVRGFELQGDTQKLEEILKRREEELKKRREYVDRLMEWHQRLDKEENEVLLIEKSLYNSNCNQLSPESQQYMMPNFSKTNVKKIKKLKEIDKSLRKIQNISEENESHKTISGSRLNKLWNRLTGRNDEKYVSNREYDINKFDLERLYEEAKDIVSRHFNNDEFLEQFKLNKSGNTSSESQFFNVSQLVHEKKIGTNDNINNNEDLENEAAAQKDGEITFMEMFQDDPEKTITISDKLNQSSNELTITETILEIYPSHNSEKNKITEIENSTDINQRLSVDNMVNTENQNEVEREPLTEETYESSTETFRPSVIVSLPKSQEDLCETNKASNEFLDEISVETKISKESSHASGINSEDLSRINSAISITSESGIFNNSNSHEKTNDSSNLGIESYIEPNIVSNTEMNINEIPQKPSEIISNISEIPSSESVQARSTNSTDIAESINSKNTNASSDVIRYDIEDSQTMFNSDYENDVFESDTLIEDISSPKFESTLEESKVDEDIKSLAEELFESNILNSNDKEISNKDNFLLNEIKNQSELEKRLIDIDDSLKDLTDVFEHALSPEKSLTPPLVNSTGILIKSPPLNDFNISSIKSNIPNKIFTTQSIEGNSISATTQKMPDIISEVEIRRRQVFIESEMNKLEQTIPYYFNREIPNKPPPPYHSPAHGSPMTIIFPSENRIKEITFKRTKELYDEITKNDNINEESNDANSLESTKSNSILDENITNIYERIVLDICQEYINEYKKTLIDSNPETYKNSLALFNPPDKLKCIQDCIYKNVRKSLGMDKLQQQQQQHNLIKNNSLYLIGKNNKRDNVDDILIQELYEEESKWVNFDIEEEQVKHAIVDEILNDMIKDVVDEVFVESIN